MLPQFHDVLEGKGDGGFCLLNHILRRMSIPQQPGRKRAVVRLR